MAMPPNEAVGALVKNQVDYVPLEETASRITATLWLVDPPGIATIVPEERLDARARPMVDYLNAFEAASTRFPGCESELQRLCRETAPNGRMRFYTYVVREEGRCLTERR